MNRFGQGPSSPTIMLVGFEETMGVPIDAELRREGFGLLAARDQYEASAWVAQKRPNLALIRLDGADGRGLVTCKEIRGQSHMPIILVAADDREADALAGFDAGADDYLNQPQRLRELVARVRAALRRSPVLLVDDQPVLCVGDVSLDASRHEIRVRGVPVELPLREFAVLEVLIATPGRVWARQALMRRVWGETPPSGTKSLDVHIRRIRARIEDNPAEPTRILTVRGVGYKYAREGDQ